MNAPQVLANQDARESGLQAFAILLAIHRIAIDPAQLRHELGHHDPLSSQDLVRLAQRIDGVRAKLRGSDWDSLAKMPLPALANGKLGWFLVGQEIEC